MWKTSVESNASASETLKEYALNYSDYMLQMRCNLSVIRGNDSSANKAGMGCCLRDREVSKGGGYCMILNNNSDDIETYFVTEDEFVDILSTYTLETIAKVADPYEGITTFKLVENADNSALTDANLENFFTGYKAQPWPAESYLSNRYRFDKGDKATGYIYDVSGNNSDKWIDETEYLLNGAFVSQVLSSVALAFLAVGAMF